MAYTGLARRPVFIPSVGGFREIELPHCTWTCSRVSELADLHAGVRQTLRAIQMVTAQPATTDGKLDPLGVNHTNKLEIRVF
jgi:N-acetyl-gamma-glutamyl-phosphate reductase